MAKNSKNYGKGEFEANPFYAGEVSEFKGKPYTIISPHGSEFMSMDIRSTNVMEDVIEENAQAGGAGKSGKGAKGKKGKVNS